MKTMTKTEWNMSHSDYKKIENGINYVTGYDLKSKLSYWVPVKIKGVKKGEVYR
jgi:hypothetical protein